MRFLGRITDWNDARGYGFVTPNGGGERAFVHVKAFERAGRRPATGDLVSYAVLTDAQGRRNATAVRAAGAASRREPMPAWRFPRKAAALLAGCALCVAASMGRIPVGVAAAYAATSVLALLLYAIDKQAAQRGGWRTKESTLHAVALLGGWPGALLAQDLFRHKSGKASFQRVFWCTVAANGAGLAWLLRRLAA